MAKSNKQVASKSAPMPKPRQKLALDEVETSGAFFDFMDEFVYEEMDDKVYVTVLTTGLLAWNLSLFHPHERRRILLKMLQNVPEEDRFEYKQTLNDMIDWKEQAFANYRRVLTDFDVAEDESGTYLVVHSAPLEESGWQNAASNDGPADSA